MTETLAVEDFPAWESQVSAAGACSHPIRLTGKVQAVNLVTRETAEVFKTWTDVPYIDGKGELDTWRDDSPLLVACGNRREAVCPACSAIYKRDARQLVRAGLAGGKGVPETVAAHPCVFATLTAPSFGPVHSRRERGGKVLPCRPRRDRHRRVCPHGRDISCPVRHAEGDPRLGRPMCPDCYDYRAAVLFNAVAGALWRRFETFLPRRLARLAGVTGKRFRELVRVRFVRSLNTRHAASSTSTPSSGSMRTPARATRRRLLDGRLTCWPMRSSWLLSRRRRWPRSVAAGRCCCGSAPRSTPGSCVSTRATRSPPMRWPTTSPSTPPKPLTPRACRPRESGHWPRFRRCAALPITGG